MGFDFGIEDAAFQFTADTRAADLADQLYLFAAKFATPRWDANPVLRAKAAARLQYESYASSPQGRARTRSRVSSSAGAIRASARQTRAKSTRRRPMASARSGQPILEQRADRGADVRRFRPAPMRSPRSTAPSARCRARGCLPPGTAASARDRATPRPSRWCCTHRGDRQPGRRDDRLADRRRNGRDPEIAPARDPQPGLLQPAAGPDARKAGGELFAAGVQQPGRSISKTAG